MTLVGDGARWASSQGGARVPRLYLPGAAGSDAFWRPVADLLASEATQELLSWPGLGNEPPNADISGLADLVCSVEARMSGPTDLIAQSMGGLVAIQVALRNPNKVRRLVLTAASVGIDAVGLGGSDWREDYRKAFPNAARWVEQPFADVRPDLARLTLPVLLIWGDADPISPLAVGQALLAGLPNAVLRVVDGGDHDLAKRKPAEVAKLVSQHLSQSVQEKV